MGIWTRLFGIVAPSSWRETSPNTDSRTVAGQRHTTMHSARFSDATVYFVFTQATTKPINLGWAVQRLLNSELATSAAWPSEDSVRLAPSIARLDRKATRLRQLDLLLRDWPGLSGLVITGLRHPRLALQLVKSIRLSDQESPLGTQDDPENEDPAVEDPLGEVEKMLFDQQKVSILERELDAGLFGGEARTEGHFVRLVLRPVNLESNITGSEHHVTIEPRLLLHRDGVTQLTIGVHLPPGASTDDLIAASYPSSEHVVQSRVPEPFAGPRDKWVGGEWAAGQDGGVRVRLIQHDEPTSPFDLSDLVLSRVRRIIKALPEGEWNCYPIVLAKPGKCCEHWADAHDDAISLIAARKAHVSPGEFRYERGRDFSVQADHSFYLNLASAFVVYWRQWSPGMRDLNVTLLLEHSLLTYTRLRALERRIREFRTRRSDVVRLYRTALDLGQELRSGTIRWGSARDISRQLLAELGTSEMRANINQGLSMLGERAGARADDRSTRSANRLAIIGAVIALVAAIPSVPAILDLIAEQRSRNPDVTAWSVVQTLAVSPLMLSALVLAGVLGYLFLSFVVVTVRVTRYLLGLRKRGYAARPTGYRVVLGGEENGTAFAPDAGDLTMGSGER